MIYSIRQLGKGKWGEETAGAGEIGTEQSEGQAQGPIFVAGGKNISFSTDLLNYSFN